MDASVPELDKLIKMSEVFGVTVDALIKGYETVKVDHPTPAIETFTTNLMKGMTSGRLAAVIILMVLGGLAFLLFTVFGGLVAGLTIATPFICCGFICMLASKRALLWCLWALFLMGDAFLTFATGAGSMSLLLYLEETGITMQTIIAGIRLLLYLALVVFTAISFRRSEIKDPKAASVWLIISLVVLVVVPVISFFFGRVMYAALYSGAANGGLELTVGTDDYERHVLLMAINGIVNFILGWIRQIAFAAAAALSVNMISNRKKKQ